MGSYFESLCNDFAVSREAFSWYIYDHQRRPSLFEDIPEEKSLVWTGRPDLHDIKCCNLGALKKPRNTKQNFTLTEHGGIRWLDAETGKLPKPSSICHILNLHARHVDPALSLSSTFSVPGSYLHPSILNAYICISIFLCCLKSCELMDSTNYFLNLVVPPVSMVMMAFAWPTLSMLHAAEWIYRSLTSEDMESKVVIITGASSAMGEKIVYQYARKKTNLVLVAKREQRLWGIRENARLLGAKQVVVIAADVVKEEDCQRFINDTVNYFGRLDHLVNTTNLEHSFYFDEALDTSIFPHLMDINFWGSVYPTYFALPYLRESRGRIIVNASVESWVPMPRMSLYAAAKAAVISFYETLRLEVNDDVGITIATHGWICRAMNQTKFVLEEGADMQWKEEREVALYGAHVEDFAEMIVGGACRGEAYVKYPSWYDVFFIYKLLIPDVIGWAFRLLFGSQSSRRSSVTRNNGASRQLLEAPPARKDFPPPLAFAPASPERHSKPPASPERHSKPPASPERHSKVE